MSDSLVPKSKCEQIRSVFGAIGTSLGIVGGLLGIASFINSCQQDAIQEHRACIDDTSNFPLGIRSNAQDMTDAVFRWAVTPDLPRAREAKREALAFQLQLQGYEKNMMKYKLANAALANHKISVDKVLDAIKQGVPDDDSIKRYSESLEDLISQSPPQCP